MKKKKFFFPLFVILLSIILILILLLVYNVFTKTRKLNVKINEMNIYVEQIEKIGDKYNLLVENKDNEKLILLENEKCEQEIEQIEKEIIDYQNKINDFK